MYQKSGLYKKSFSMIIRLEIILSVVFYGRKKITFYEKNLKLMKNNTLNNIFFVIEFFRTIAPYQFSKKWLDFHKSWIIFLRKYSLQLYIKCLNLYINKK